MKIKWLNPHKERELEYVTVYLTEGEPIIYNEPTNCWESQDFLRIKQNGKMIAYRLSHIVAYEFKLKGFD